MPKKPTKKPTPEVEDTDLSLEEEVETEDGLDADVAPEEEIPSKEPAAKKSKEADQVIFVNKEKLNRANDILLLIAGKRPPRETSEVERQQHYSSLLAARGLKPTDPAATQAIYEILGGLVRTPAEQAEAEKVAREMAAKFKRKKVEEDKS